jgi:FlaA1/EpsC-like NDP-sugar epimerase
VQLSGLTVRDDLHPDGDIEIVVTGLRPGEKLYEELLIGDNPELTAHARIMKAHEAALTWDDLQPHLVALRSGAERADTIAIKWVLQTCVHGYGVAPI